MVLDLIMFLMAFLSIHSLNVYGQLSSGTRGLNFGLSFYLQTLFRCASSECSGARAFTAYIYTASDSMSHALPRSCIFNL